MFEQRIAAVKGEASRGENDAPKRSPNTKVQDQILLAIEREPASNVTALAGRLGSARPSVSRALNALARELLVAKNCECWELTERGREAADRLKEQIPQQMTQVLALAEKSILHQSKLAETACLSMSEAFRAEYLKATDALVALSAAALQHQYDSLTKEVHLCYRLQKSDVERSKQLREQIVSSQKIDVAGLSKSLLGSINFEKALTFNSRAIESLLSGQRASVAAMMRHEFLATSESWARPLPDYCLRSTSLEIGHSINDLNGIHSQALKDGFLAGGSNALFKTLRDVANRYDVYMREMTQRLVEPLAHREQIARDLALPTAVTRTFVATARNVVAADTDAEIVRQVSVYEPRNDDDFLRSLESVGPGLTEQWAGARSVLESPSPDRVRQAAHSVRELLMQTLAMLAPDSCFTEEEIQQEGHKLRVTQKMRVRRILNSSSAAEWADSVAKGIEVMAECTYQQLCKISHDRTGGLGGPQRQIGGIMLACQGLLMFLIPDPDGRVS